MENKLKEAIPKYGGALIRGFAANNVHLIAKGALNEMLTEIGINLKTATGMVEKNLSLWDSFGKEVQEELVSGMVELVGSDVEWLTADWLTDAVKKKHPALASYFASSPRAREWLERQVASLQEQMKEANLNL